MDISFTCGNKKEAISIMQEAAHWLVDIGQPMWDDEDLSSETLNNPFDEFLVMWEDKNSIASMILSYEDKIFWPNIAPNTSGFIHKLSIRRDYASKGYAKILVEHAKKLCANKSIKYLRLDCDPHREGLLNFYKACGFILVEMKVLHTKKWGKIDLAMFEMEC